MDDKDREELGEGLNERAKAPQEYASDPTVHHIGNGAKVNFVLRWYGFTSTEDTT